MEKQANAVTDFISKHWNNLTDKQKSYIIGGGLGAGAGAGLGYSLGGGKGAAWGAAAGGLGVPGTMMGINAFREYLIAKTGKPVSKEQAMAVYQKSKDEEINKMLNQTQDIRDAEFRSYTRGYGEDPDRWSKTVVDPDPMGGGRFMSNVPKGAKKNMLASSRRRDMLNMIKNPEKWRRAILKKQLISNGEGKNFLDTELGQTFTNSLDPGTRGKPLASPMDALSDFDMKDVPEVSDAPIGGYAPAYHGTSAELSKLKDPSKPALAAVGALALLGGAGYAGNKAYKAYSKERKKTDYQDLEDMALLDSV